ncbi:facilitated trehalose transporter Tret1-like isoform X1 [Homalodisca vitripennis]|nr:facilitated trehalose transporter Tret1-like isoform X1 [Homalodisca vitripennis]
MWEAPTDRQTKVGAHAALSPLTRVPAPPPAPPHYFSQVQCGHEGAAGIFKPCEHLNLISAALAVSLGPFAAGLGKGYSSPAIASIQEKQQYAIHTGNYSGAFVVSPQQQSWVASLSLLGALFGAIFGGIAMKFGRKRVLVFTSIPFSASWLVTVFANSVEIMFATGFVGGFCCAIVLLVSQVYISEIAGPDIRGCLSAVLKIFGHIGVLISFAVGAYLDWRQLAFVVAGAPLMLLMSILYIPETPSYLVLSGREQEAAKALRWLRGPHADIRPELATLRDNVLASRTFRPSSKQSLSVVLHPILITCGLMLFQRFSGANAFNFYAVSIFRQTFGGMDPHGGAVAVAFVQLLASLLSGLLIDTVGRLPLLIASSVFMSIALAAFGSFAYYEHIHRDRVAAQYDWIPLLCVLVFTIAFSMGISPISWLLIAELFPLEYRGLGSALATSFSYACAFIGVKTFVDFQELLGLHGAFWLYAAISVCGLCFIVCFVPETKGKGLDELDHRYVRA